MFRLRQKPYGFSSCIKTDFFCITNFHSTPIIFLHIPKILAVVCLKSQINSVAEQPHILNVNFKAFSTLTCEVGWFWFAGQRAFSCVCLQVQGKEA